MDTGVSLSAFKFFSVKQTTKRRFEQFSFIEKCQDRIEQHQLYLNYKLLCKFQTNQSRTSMESPSDSSEDEAKGGRPRESKTIKVGLQDMSKVCEDKTSQAA